MHCQSAQGWLVEYVFGDAPAGIAQEVSWHLAHCHACQREVEALRGVLGKMSAHVVPDPSPNFEERLLNTVRQHEWQAAQHATWSKENRLLALAMAGQGGIVMFLILYFLMAHPGWLLLLLTGLGLTAGMGAVASAVCLTSFISARVKA